MPNVSCVFEKNQTSTIVGHSINKLDPDGCHFLYIFADFMPNICHYKKGMLQLPSIIVDYLSLLSVLPVSFMGF